jgi:hypothetical protein
MIIDDVSMKRYPKSVSNFLYRDFVLSESTLETHTLGRNSEVLEVKLTENLGCRILKLFRGA